MDISSLLNVLGPISAVLMPLLWGCFAVYVLWYFSSAKRIVPMTYGEVKMLWIIHKRLARCSAKRWQDIRRGGKIVGFECECGYEYIEKRPLI